jgi:hypothetical protein
MFKVAVSDLFSVAISNKATLFIHYLTETNTVSISYHELITITVVLMCLALFMLIYINRSHQKGDKVDEIFNEITLSRNPGNIWILLKKHSSETLSDAINFIKMSYSETIEGFINKDIRVLQKISAALNRQTNKQKKEKKRELLTLKRIDKNTTLEKSTWLHLTNSCTEQMIYCMKRITEPCIEYVSDNPGYLSEQSITEITATGHLFKSLMLRIKNAIQSSDYSEYEQLFFTSAHISEELSRLHRRLTDYMRKEVENDPKTFNLYLHILQESEELVCILRLLLRASRKLQSDQRF